MVELRIPVWPGGIAFGEGESLRLEIKGHDQINEMLDLCTKKLARLVASQLPPTQILPDYPPLTDLNKGRHFFHTGGGFQSRLVLPLAQAQLDRVCVD